MPITHFPSPEEKKIIRGIPKKYEASQLPGESKVLYDPQDFEKDIQRWLDMYLPFSALPGVRIYSPQRRLQDDFGIEVDHLLHFGYGAKDFIVIIEAKKQLVVNQEGKWTVTYEQREKCAKSQVSNHIDTIEEYLRPFAKTVDVKFLAVVVSADKNTESVDGKKDAKGELYLRPINKLPELLRERFNFKEKDDKPIPKRYMISQSPFLDLLRTSIPLPHLGHPEIESAIQYVERCRRSLDETLYKEFNPKKERWLINGSAGMGKSVLLAYTAAVFCSGYELNPYDGFDYLKSADERLNSIGFDLNSQKRPIWIVSNSIKQNESVQQWYRYFIQKFRDADRTGQISFVQPEFILLRNVEDINNDEPRAILIDEAHDLPRFAEKIIADKFKNGGMYLVAACDRHQKLRIAGSEANSSVIKGINFSGKSTRLNQIYRTPAPIYIASLALMCRWFSKEGPIILPSNDQLKKHFGFHVDDVIKKTPKIIMQNDCHPGNSWCHTVSRFSTVYTAFNSLSKRGLGRKDVLWVRFSEEETEFDYEMIQQKFTYHNCRHDEADKTTDKYIKGQEFPVVVIEGFPGFMNRYESEEDEKKMWSFRREVYLCASRATCFLYFVVNQSDEGKNSISNEIDELVDGLSRPETGSTGGTSKWSYRIQNTKFPRDLATYIDTEDEVEEEGASELQIDAREKQKGENKKSRNEGELKKSSKFATGPISIVKLAERIGVNTNEIIIKTEELGFYLTVHNILKREHLEKLLPLFGYTLDWFSESQEKEDTELGEIVDSIIFQEPCTPKLLSEEMGVGILQINKFLMSQFEKIYGHDEHLNFVEAEKVCSEFGYKLEE